MNYDHAYHAGNFADIAKHVALVACLEALKRKPTAFFALDTHAGRGDYDLDSAEAHRSGEAERGIRRLLADLVPGAAPVSALEPYLQALGAAPERPLRRYPGSAGLIAAALRPGDRAVLVELDAPTARAAERRLESRGRLQVEIGDGYTALRARLPPPERRGLVLIDPPFERPDELEVLVAAVREAFRRWSTGIYLVWFPIRSAVQRAAVRARFRGLEIPKMLSADLAIYPDDAGVGLAGSGLVIINPPYGVEEPLRGAYRRIHDVLGSPGSGYSEVSHLTPERAFFHRHPRTEHEP